MLRKKSQSWVEIFAIAEARKKFCVYQRNTVESHKTK